MAESFDALLNKIGNVPLLTAAEEKDLAKRIERGDHRAKQELVERNIRLAVSIARRYTSHGIPLEDLVHEGVLGLHRAAEKFDWRKDYKFSTYAVWWIRHMVQRAVYKNRATIRQPGHVVERRRKLERAMREHQDWNLADAADSLGLTLAQAEEAMNGARVVSSLDAPYPGEADGDRYGTIPDDEASDPAEIASDDYPALTRALAKLTPLERDVIRMRFGFDAPVMKRDQVAVELTAKYGYEVKPYAVQRAQSRALVVLRDELGADIFEEE